MNEQIEGKYKLFNTDGKTFFDFRSDPKSRCEGFTVSFLDDGTVVLSGDYGTLCWRRERSNQFPDYGFPSKETGIGYFAEKVCQWGVKQVIEEFDKDTFVESLKESYEDNEKWEEFLDDIKYIEDKDEWKIRETANDYFTDSFECNGNKYTDYFLWNFERLQSVSDQIWDAVKKSEQKNVDIPDANCAEKLGEKVK